MPLSVIDLISQTGLTANGLETVRWGNKPKSAKVGIYIVSTSQNPALNDNLFASAPIDNDVLQFWLNKVTTLQIDGNVLPTVSQLRDRLNQFWFPDESILYIGQTESSKGIAGRVGQYYRTELGERKPHAGGHWIKTLATLNQLFVHYFPDNTPTQTEENLLRTFVRQVSRQTLENLRDKNLPIPFANLELEKGNRKNHGISKSKLGD
jgi:hypothetical protein